MERYKIVLEEEGVKRQLDITPDHKEEKDVQKLSVVYTITEKGNDLGKLVFKNGKYHYEGNEQFSPDDINLIALSLTSNQKETVIDSEEDDIDDEEEE